jgi:hypothetical protein
MSCISCTVGRIKRPLDSEDWSTDFHGYRGTQQPELTCGSPRFSTHVNPGFMKFFSRNIDVPYCSVRLISIFLDLSKDIQQDLLGLKQWDIYQNKQQMEIFYLDLAQACSCYGVLRKVLRNSHQQKCHSCPRKKTDIITKPLPVFRASFAFQQAKLGLPAKNQVRGLDKLACILKHCQHNWLGWGYLS